MGKKKGNTFKVVETKKMKAVEAKEKPETDEEFHRKMVQETSRKSKKKKNIDLLLTNEEDDFVKDDKSHIGDESEDEDDDLDAVLTLGINCILTRIQIFCRSRKRRRICLTATMTL